DGRVGSRPDALHQLLERLAGDVVAAKLIIEVRRPVHVYGAGNVSRRVEQGVFVRLDEPDGRVVEVRGKPVGRDQSAGMRIATFVDAAHPGIIPSCANSSSPPFS